MNEYKFPEPLLIGATIRVPSHLISEEMLALFRYPNPKINELKRLNLSTYGVPEFIPTYWKNGRGEFFLMRGELRKLLALFGTVHIKETSIAGVETGVVYCNEDFQLDERQERAVRAIQNKKQGIIHAATSAGKSAIILAALAERNVSSLVIVRSKILQQQLYEDAKRWLKHSGTAPLLGRIGNGKRELGRPITLAIDKSLARLLEEDPSYRDAWGCVIVDECHLVPANTFLNILNQLNARYRYGLSGTLKRKDGMEFLIYASFGEVIATITKEELLQADRISRVDVEVVYSEASVPEALLELPATKKHQAIDACLHTDKDRLTLIVNYAKKILEERPDARIVIVSRYVDPCYQIMELLKQAGLEAGTITGQDKDGGEVCRRINGGSLRVACATLGCFSTGVNIPSLTDIILISPCFSNELLIHQLRGRLMRKAEGKTHGTLHVVWDQYVFAPYRLANFLRIIKK